MADITCVNIALVAGGVLTLSRAEDRHFHGPVFGWSRSVCVLPRWRDTTLQPASRTRGCFMHRGYVKQWRKTLESEVFKDKDPWLFKVWEWCKMKANYKAAPFKGTIINPGQFVTSIALMAEIFSTNRSRMRRILQRLAEMQNVTIQTNNHWSVVTVCNWKTYQQDRVENDCETTDQTTDKRPTNEPTSDRPMSQPVDTIKEGKEKKERKEPFFSEEGLAAEADPKPIPKAKKPKPKPTPKPRERNPLFDAVAEATGLDPRTAGSSIGKVAFALQGASYSVDDVLQFVREMPLRFPWAKGNLTPSFLQQNIGTIRTPLPQDQGGRNGRQGQPSMRYDPARDDQNYG